jgi:DNA-binding MarR family transcriptional regulator/GNAT superfamily N-acetyltransferase
MTVDEVGTIRRFQRTVTQRIGALQDSYLARDRSLGESRLLWEIGVDGTDVRLLRSRLDLDSGYISRLLRSLESSGLVRVEANTSDARRRTAYLTEAGHRELAVLDARADALATSILEPLTPAKRERLVAAAAEVERLFVASSVRIDAIDPAHPDARSCVSAYAAELDRRLDRGFDPDRSPADDDAVRPPAGLMLIARLHNDPVGCGLLLTTAGNPALIKRMWVASGVRGLGLGRRLLAELEGHAAAAGHRTIRLETNHALTEAITLYQAAGYRKVASFSADAYADHWFEKALQP